MIIEGPKGVENRRILLFSFVATAVLSLVPISSQATVDWNEGFEYADATALYDAWGASCPPSSANPTVSTDRAYSGSKSLKLTYHGIVGVDPGAGGCWMDRSLNGLSDTLYERFMIYIVGGFRTVGGVGTKLIFSGQNGAYPSFWWDIQGAGLPINLTIQGIILDNGTQDSHVVWGSDIPKDQWVCIETRLTMSSPGVDNGIVQSWINGNQVINSSTQRMRAATLNQLNSPTAQFQFVRHYTQHGSIGGIIYYDDHAVSRDERIGCGTRDTAGPANHATGFGVN